MSASDAEAPRLTRVLAWARQPYAAVFLVLVAAGFVPVLWPQLDLTLAALFIGPDKSIASAQWAWVRAINSYVPLLSRTSALLCLLLWMLSAWVARLAPWRFALAFVAIATAVGPGIVVNGVVKDTFGRARPSQVQDFGGTRQFTPALQVAKQCTSNCAFVSGHTASAFMLAGVALLGGRRRLWWLYGGVAAGLLTGFARMSVGAHWFSDVLWAGVVTLACCAAVAGWLKVVQPVYVNDETLLK